jgi:signal peptidase I
MISREGYAININEIGGGNTTAYTNTFKIGESMLGKRKYATAFDTVKYDDDRYGRHIPTDFFATGGVGHNVYASRPREYDIEEGMCVKKPMCVPRNYDLEEGKTKDEPLQSPYISTASDQQEPDSPLFNTDKLFEWCSNYLDELKTEINYK